VSKHEEDRSALQLQEHPPLQSSETEMSVVELIGLQASRRPEAIALSGGSNQLTYSQLHRRSDLLARSLHAKDVTTETVVAVLASRSPGFVVAALAILKAGAAYLPLDPSTPTEQLSYMLGDSGATIVIAEESLAPLCHDCPASLMLLSREAVILDPESTPSAEVPEVHRQPHELAYIIYTSGSTGRPKGVEILHRGLTNLVHWHNDAFAITSEDRATQFANLSFDAAAWELWPYLAAGATVEFVPERLRRDARLLRDWLVAKRITVAFAPTALAEPLMAAPWPNNSSLRLLLTGADTLRRFPRPGLPFQLINNYGPTECTVVATSGAISADSSEVGLPTIGRPIGNTRILILDAQLQPVAPGEPGEICIGGPGVGRGYRNSPDLSEKKFISDPSGSGTGKLYRTGDLGRILPDGQIAFLGRIDDQLKIDGHRIEPNHIAKAIEQFRDVETSVVVARDDGEGHKHLVAYVVLRNGMQVGALELRDFLGARLPGYMVPVIFVRIHSVPLTRNGKVDRASLPSPDAFNILGDHTDSIFENELEEQLAEIVCKLLHVKSVGAADNFFNLGGHSLLATQLIVRIREAFDVELGLREVFEAPTIQQLAHSVEEVLAARIATISDDQARQLLTTISQSERQVHVGQCGASS
jgi:amino acid adenylation domain-containing protein